MKISLLNESKKKVMEYKSEKSSGIDIRANIQEEIFNA
jgi:dUTPase